MHTRPLLTAAKGASRGAKGMYSSCRVRDHGMKGDSGKQELPQTRRLGSMLPKARQHAAGRPRDIVDLSEDGCSGRDACIYASCTRGAPDDLKAQTNHTASPDKAFDPIYKRTSSLPFNSPNMRTNICFTRGRPAGGGSEASQARGGGRATSIHRDRLFLDPHPTSNTIVVTFLTGDVSNHEHVPFQTMHAHKTIRMHADAWHIQPRHAPPMKKPINITDPFPHLA